MISSRKRQLVITLILTCTCAPALAQEPNEVKTELKFEINAEKVQSLYGKIKTMRTPIRPTHVAYFAIEWYHWQPTEPNISEILQTPIGQTVSQLQRDLLRAVPAIPLVGTKRRMEKSWFGSYHCGSNKYAVYAVSQEDAKKMAQALVEVLMKEADVALGPILKSYINKMLSKKQELEKNVAEFQAQLSQKRAEKEDADAELRRRLKDQPYLLNVILHEGELVLNTDLPKLTEQMIQEMGKMLEIINVEIVGIQAKLSAIEKYKSKPNVSIAVLARLDEILCEQSIELAGALARKKQATESRARYQDLYNLHSQWETAVYKYEKVRRSLLRSQRELSKLKEHLTNPSPDMLPPKVYQNKVTIYPVRVEDK